MLGTVQRHGRVSQMVMRQEAYAGDQLVNRVGFWAAVLATVFSVAFVITAVLSSLVVPVADWQGIEAYAAAFRTLDVIPVVPPLLLAPAFVVLMASVHRCVADERKVLSLSALSFSVVYAAIIWIIDYVQLTVVRQNILGGVTDGLALWAMPNMRSLFFALEAVAYGFMSLSTLVAAPLFGREGVERWVRWLFLANGFIGIGGVVAYAFGHVTVVFLGLALWCIEFPIATGLLAVLFRRAQREVG